MSNPIPASQLALTTPVNGTTADATPVASDFSQLQVAVNQLIVALSGGTTGQFLQAADATDVVWGNAADKSSVSAQVFAGAVEGTVLGSTYTTASIAGGSLPTTSSATRITATDASSVAHITGNVGASFLTLVNATGGSIPFITGGGGASAIGAPFTLLINCKVFLVYDTTATAWIPLVISGPSGPVNNGKVNLTYGATVTPDAALGSWQTIPVSNSTAFTIAAPLNPPGANDSRDLTIEVSNISGGAHGAITMNAIYVGTNTLAGATVPNGKKLACRFAWNGAAWVMVAQSGASGVGY